MASGRDQTGPGLGRLSAAAGSAGLSGGREHPGDQAVGPACSGEAVGARGEEDEAVMAAVGSHRLFLHGVQGFETEVLEYFGSSHRRGRENP